MWTLYLGLLIGGAIGWIACGLFVSHKARRLQAVVEQLRAGVSDYQVDKPISELPSKED